MNLYIWNARNQLVAITGAGVTASFSYDALGRRQSRSVNGASTQFLYDGLNPIQEAGPTGLATLLTGVGIDEYLTRTDSTGAQQHFLTDALGSTLALADPAATLPAQYTYEPFGASSVTGATSGNPFQYMGREHDGTGLYYYRARYYHPGLQRFISEDPVGFDGGDVNFFAYVLNNPLLYSDPYGLKVIYQTSAVQPPSPAVLANLEKLNGLVPDRDVIITSGSEPRKKPREGSLHPGGGAADIKIPGLTSAEVAELGAQVGFKGISTYDSPPGHTHVDVREREWNGHNGNTLRHRPAWRISGEQKAGSSSKSSR